MGVRHRPVRRVRRGAFQARRRAWRAALATTVAAAACGAPASAPPSAVEITAYLDSRAARRSALEASLADVENDYANLRRARYAIADGAAWEALPAWNPPVQPIDVADLSRERSGAAGPLRADDPFAAEGPAPRALDLGTGAAARDPEALRALGAEAFFAYPVQLLPLAATLGPQDLARYGLWADGARGLGGLVRATMADGSARLAYTCATCHAAPDPAGGVLAIGLGNAAFDLGAWLADAGGAPADDPLRSWGPGRADVATATGRLPVVLPDLRATRFLTHLHWEADVAQLGITSLAIRIETLLITSLGEAVRPPREVALGLALYLWSLADTLRAPSDEAGPGRAVFRARCAGCHAGPGMTGPPVAASAVGTDPAAAIAPERGTGRYRPPSLLGASARGRLLHDGFVRDLDDLLDPARVAPGHRFGDDLDAPSRAALVSYLRSR